MSTTSLTRGKVSICIETSVDKEGNKYAFLKENSEGKSVLGNNGKYYLLFETKLENKNVLNVLKYEPGRITLLKYGDVQSKFEFELNRWTKCYCYIQGGFIDLNCFCEMLNPFISKTLAEFVIRYKLYAGNSLIGTYNFNATYKI